VRLRQGLNVESGLNDGVCVPLLRIVLAGAEADAHATTGHHAVTVVLEEIGYGLLAGVTAGGLAAAIVLVAGRHGLMADSWLRVIPVASAAWRTGAPTRSEDPGSSPPSSPGCASVRCSASRPRASPA
jgi:sodium/hydrogen antiporter